MSTLLIGQTDYFSEQELLAVFTDRKLIAVGALAKPSKKIRQLDLTSVISLDTIYQSYAVDEVVYFSKSLNSLENGKDEFQQLEIVLNSLIGKSAIKFIFVTGPDLNYGSDSSRRIALQSAEALCSYYQQQHGLSLKIVRSLHLYAATKADDLLGLLTQEASPEDTAPALTIHPDQPAYFIYPSDLLGLLFRMFDNWDDRKETLSVASDFSYTYQELVKALNLSDERQQQLFDRQLPLYTLTAETSDLHKLYGWFPKVSLLDDLPTGRPRLPRVVTPKAGFSKIIYKLGEQKGYLKFLQLLALFAASELMVFALGQQVYFRLIDYRLLFVILSGLLFGTSYGLMAALLASVGLLAGNVLAGTNLSTLFFEPSNWIIYIVYFIVGAVGGSIRERAKDEASALHAQNDKLTHQLTNDHAFIEDLLDRQSDLTKQIISRQDSHGQIYQFLRSLNTPYTDVFLMVVVQHLAEVFDTRSVRIYRAEAGQHTARLQLAATRKGLQPSLDLDKLSNALDQIKENQIWVNHRLRANHPMFMSCLTDDQQEPLYIVIDSVPSSKMSLYHQNVFLVLTGLVQIAYQHLCFYNDQTTAKRFLKGTGSLILNETTFRQHLELLEGLEIGHFKQRIFRIDAETPQAAKHAAQLLNAKMALTDALGSLNGELYLMTNSHTGMTSLDWENYWQEMGIATSPVTNLDEVLAFAQLEETV